MPTIGSKCGRKIRAYGASTANIGNEHTFLHSPSIVAIDEPLNSAIAIVLAYRMIIVYRLAFREKAIVRRQDRKRLALQEEYHQVRFLCRMRTIVIRDFRCPNDISNAATVEPCNFPATEQPILQYPMQLPRDFVFVGLSEAKASGRICAK